MTSTETDDHARPGRKSLTAGLIASVVAAALFGGLWLTSRSAAPDEIDQALAEESPAAHDTAEEVVTLLINLDAESVEEGGRRVLELSTGNFRADYEELLPGLGPAFEEAGAAASGEIIEGPDITFSAVDEAVAVAQVAQTTTVEGTERTVAFTVRLTLVKDQDAWKADAFELLGEL
ncbi:MAG: hypothetical protein ACRDK3_00335 [Actinomycetota bacterium]